MNIRQKIFHYLNGVRSGIPVCCINFWVRNVNDYDRYPKGIGATLYEERHGKEFDVFGDNDCSQADYVRCPHCFSNNHVVKVKENGTIMHWLLP